MAYESDNIQIGAGNLFIKAASDNDYVDVGGCRDASLDVKQKNLNIEIDQVLDPVDRFIIGREATFMVTLVEASFRNLAIAVGLDPADIDTTDPDKDVFTLFGNQILSVGYMKLKYDIPQLIDKTKSVRYFADRVKVDGNVQIGFDKDKEQVYKVKLTIFPDPDSDPVWRTLYVEKDK